jgi:hypothetical protein
MVKEMAMPKTIDTEAAQNRRTLSPCCNGHITVVLNSVSTMRRVIVYECTQCQRIYVADSRDDQQEAL